SGLSEATGVPPDVPARLRVPSTTRARSPSRAAASVTACRTGRSVAWPTTVGAAAPAAGAAPAGWAAKPAMGRATVPRLLPAALLAREGAARPPVEGATARRRRAGVTRPE